MWGFAGGGGTEEEIGGDGGLAPSHDEFMVMEYLLEKELV
jgi:hypothetical protein